MKMIRLLLLLCAVPLLNACTSTARQLKEQELRFLEDRARVVEETKVVLGQDPDPESKSDFSVFVSGTELNDVLALLDYRTLPLPDVDDKTYVDIGTVRTSFDYGSAGLTIVASARRENLNVRLRFRAEIQPEVKIEDESPVLHLRIFVHEIVPDVKWSYLNFRVSRFLRDLARIEANRFLESINALKFPLETVTEFEMEGSEQKKDIYTNPGTIYGVFRIPPVSADVAFKVDRLLLLPDGVHAFFSFE